MGFQMQGGFAIPRLRRGGGGRRIRWSYVSEITTMIVIGIILSFVSLGFLCWLLFALAVQALPVFVGISAGMAAYHGGSGEICPMPFRLIAGARILPTGQIALAAVLSPVIRSAI